MIPTGRQIREGRKLAGLSQVELAEATDVALDLVARIEATDCTPSARKRDSNAIRSALVAAGVEFIPESGSGAGVRLRKAEQSDRTAS